MVVWIPDEEKPLRKGESVNVKKSVVASGAVTVVLAGGLLVTAPAASADSCGPGQTARSTTQEVKNPLTGEMEKGTVTECVKADEFTGKTISFVTPAVGVDFRDDNGNRTASGLSSNDQFEYLGEKRAGVNGDGTLIRIRQITTGKGGWGSRYEGWIPVKYTSVPSLFD